MMMVNRRGICELGFVSLLLWWSLTCSAASVSSDSCPVEPAADSILGFRDSNCFVGGGGESRVFVGVTEGDEVSLQKALNMVHESSRDYVGVLFYASWCPFSRTFRHSYSVMSSLYPSIPHFAIEESAIRPSILSKYGVHGFPTLFLLNSTMRVRYHGSRTLGSFVAFYSDVTGIKTELQRRTSVDKIGFPSKHEKQDEVDQENCPFPWARSPENMLRQETYLALATAFVLLRLLYWLYPTLRLWAQYNWRRHIPNVRFRSFSEHLLAYMSRTIQSVSSLEEPCRRSNLQEGAMNAKAWASKSLATVSIGDASTSKGVLTSECR